MGLMLQQCLHLLMMSGASVIRMRTDAVERFQRVIALLTLAVVIAAIDRFGEGFTPFPAWTVP
jgi:hypothetical protein